MCGIAGRFQGAGLPADSAWHARADALLAHRGPDGRGHYADEWCELVHRRLALIDLSPSGAQPMCNEDASVYVTFNGEIYNHRELRATLERRGHRFRSTSDTEVLVHLYEEDGESMAAALRGIFAFGIYDRRRRSLLLVRDRFGVKPLFYAVHDGQVVFASEIKAILALSGFQPRIDRQACYDFLGLGYVPEPATGFANIHALPRATSLTVRGDRHELRQYAATVAQPELGYSMSDTVALAEESLQQAVVRQSVADVSVAALLSGGIDSSLVVAAHSRSSGEPPTTFNVRFPDRQFDETAMALDVATQYGTRHHIIDLGDHAVSTDAILELLRHFDQPFTDMSLVPMYWIARAVRERGFICTLSGDGGDEVFGGYSRFWRADRLVPLMRLPGWVSQGARAFTGALAGRTRDWGRQAAKAIQLAAAGRRDSAFIIAGLSNYLSEEQKQELVEPEAREELRTVYRHFDGYEPPGTADVEELSRRITENLFAIGLPSDMLRKVDMMSMRASIEVRVPMLDEELVAFGLTLPHRFKTDGTTGKRVLRELARRWLPPRVAAHPKHGFGIPLDVMVPADFHRCLDELLLSTDARTRTVLHVPLVRHWLARFERARQGEHGGTISRGGLYQRVFMVLALELFLREHNLVW